MVAVEDIVFAIVTVKCCQYFDFVMGSKLHLKIAINVPTLEFIFLRAQAVKPKMRNSLKRKIKNKRLSYEKPLILLTSSYGPDTSHVIYVTTILHNTVNIIHHGRKKEKKNS